MKDRIMRFNFRIALQVLIAFTLLAGYMFAFIPQPVYAADWYNSSWTYRKSIVIDQTDDLGADAKYQMKLLVGKSSSATGEQVDCNDHCEADFDDLRFTKSDGTTLLDYWIESVSGSGSSALATVWIETILLDDAADTTIYMYYGNSSATSASNGANTWIKFDDASANNSANYTLRDIFYSGVNASLAYVDSTDGYKITMSANDTVMAELNTLSSGGAYRIRAQEKISSVSNNGQFGFCGRYTTSGVYIGRNLQAGDVSIKNISMLKEATPPNTTVTQFAATNFTNYCAANTFYWQEFAASGSSFKMWSEWENKTLTGTDSSYSTGTWGIYAGFSSGIQVNFKNVCVGNYTATEPTWKSFGNEEAAAPTVTTQAATLVEETTATGNGNITSLNGGSNCTVRGFQYDVDTGAPYAYSAYDSGSFGTGAYTKALTGLTKGELYYIRAYATSPLGTGYGSEVTFLTKPDAPTGFTATAGDAKVDLSWTKGAGAQKTIIRGKKDSYPANIADGLEVYNDTGTSTTHSGLSAGEHWYYRAWSYVTEGALEQYSDAYAEDDAITVSAPVITTGICSGFTDKQAILNATVVSQDPAITVYGFDYGLTTGYGSEVLTTSSIANGATYWKAPNDLLPASKYHYRAKAYNGSWGYGADATFSTVGSPVLYETLSSGQDSSSDNITGNTWAYMQFTAGTVSHTVTSLQVYIKRIGNPGTVTIGLFHASGGVPTGNALATTTFNGDSIATSYTTYSFPITETGIEGGLQYAIVIAAPNGTTEDCIVWGIDDGGGLANAIYGTSVNGGLSYTADATADALFGIWGNPSIDVIGANVFSGYKVSGDWLIVADTYNAYLPYYPNSNIETLFQLQLIDDTTIVASTPFKAWQRQPLSIYLSPATAGTLTWGGSYKIRIQLLGSDTVYSEYALQTADWQSGGLLYLDGYIRNLAGIYETYYTELNGTATTYLEDSSTGSKILNSAGGVIFIRGINQISSVRPDLFKYSSSTIPVNSGEISAGTADARVIMSDRVGTQIYGILDSMGDSVGLDPVEFASAITWGLMILCALLCGVGQFGGGLIAGLGFVAIGLVFGSITFAMIGILALLAAVIIGLRIFINNSG